MILHSCVGAVFVVMVKSRLCLFVFVWVKTAYRGVASVPSSALGSLICTSDLSPSSIGSLLFP